MIDELEPDVELLDDPDRRGTWVQSERKALQLLAELNRDNPKAATLMLVLMANMDNQAALVASQETLADLCKCGLNTIKRAVAVLVKGNWIETSSIGKGRGSTLSYSINNRVAWADKRKNLEYAHVNAKLILAKKDQEEVRTEPLIQVAILAPDEEVVPHGVGIDPPAQDEFDETLRRLPTVNSEKQAIIEAAGRKAGAIHSKTQKQD